MSLKLTAKINTDGLTARIRKFEEDLKDADVRLRKDAASTATTASRQQWASKLTNPRRPKVPSGRLKRPSTEGRFSDMIEWVASPTRSTVRFQVEAFEPKFYYWVIQEIGTGNSAAVFHVIDDGVDVWRRFTVKSQSGRPITRKLGWADAVGGPFEQSSSRRNQQLYLKENPDKIRKFETLNKEEQADVILRNIVIRTEIEAKQYIRVGSEAGATIYVKGIQDVVRRLLAG